MKWVKEDSGGWLGTELNENIKDFHRIILIPEGEDDCALSGITVFNGGFSLHAYSEKKPQVEINYLFVADYKVRKRYHKDSLSGSVNLAFGTSLKSVNGVVLSPNDEPLFYEFSQDSLDHLISDTEDWELRTKLIDQILGIGNSDEAFWEKALASELCNSYRRTECPNTWLWNYKLYHAPIIDLSLILGQKSLKK